MLMLALSCWAISDSVARGAPIPTFARVWYFIFGIILVPIYVIGTRGWRGVGWVAIHVIAWMTTVMASWFVFSILIALIKGDEQ